MKSPTMSLPLIFLSLALALAVTAPSAVRGQPIVDSSGEILRPGVNYYILTAVSGSGFVPGNSGIYQPDLCPPGVVQSRIPGFPGIPVTISPWNGVLGFVPESTNVTIEFVSDIWLCSQSKTWKTVFAAWLRGSYVSTGGEIGNGDSWFQIEKDPIGAVGYRIVDARTSEPLTIFTGNDGVRGLVVGVGSQPVIVYFTKVSDANHLKLLKETK